MTMDLSGSQGKEHFNNTSWQMLLDLALRNGWKPAGVVRRELRPEDFEDETDLDQDEEDETDLDADQDDEMDEDEEPSALLEEAEEDEDEESEESAEGQAVPIPEEAAQALAALLGLSFPSDPVLGLYFCNDGNRVTAEDAAALADALERALPDLPQHDALGHKSFEHPSEPGVRLIRSDTPVNPFEWFSGKNKKRVEEFIAYCRKGGFEIW
jgi:hypothetical protein